MKNYFFHFILSLVFLQNASASPVPSVNILEMRKKLIEQNKHIDDLSKEMDQVESHLAMSSKRYSKLSDERLKLEEGLNIAKKNADLDNQNLKKNYQETKNLLMGILLNKMEKEETPANILSKRILIENLQRQLVDLNGLIKSNKDVLDETEKIAGRLQDSVKTEKELVAIMRDLEMRKKGLQETLETETQKKDLAAKELSEIKNKTILEKIATKKADKRKELAPMQITEEIKIPPAHLISDGEFYSPLSDHLQIEHQKKGVTFSFQGKNEVRATRAGKIVYTGALANYGNVVMIDHGREMRSVILGQFDYVIKNGDTVKDSELIGYTKSKSTNGLGDGKIYFEVRKNNLAQNTYLLLDKKSLANNTSK